MVKVVFASLVAGVAAGGTLGLTWEDCGDASTHGKTDDIEPTEITVGQDTTITGTGSTDKEITSGTFAMKLTASMGIKDTFTGKICEPATFKIPLNLGTVSWAGMDCPVAVGPSKVVLGVKMASILPAALAKADLALTALDQDGEQAVCVNTHLKKNAFEAEVTGTLGVTWEDCGATHAKVNDVQPSSIATGGTSTITGTGVSDEDVTSAKFTATVKALGVQVAKCSGDATEDIVCKLPAGAATITVKKVDFPLKAGTVTIPVDVTTKSIIPASLEKVDVHIEATEQNGESVICLDVHTKKAEVIV